MYKSKKIIIVFLSVIMLIGIALTSFGFSKRTHNKKQIKATDKVVVNEVVSNDIWVYLDKRNEAILHLTSAVPYGTLDVDYYKYVSNRDSKIGKIAKNSIKKIIIDDEIVPISCAYFFAGYGNLIEIVNFENLNTDNVVDMSYMFYNCYYLEKLDLSPLNTNKATNMSYMFYGCEKMSDICLTNINTSNYEFIKYK